MPRKGHVKKRITPPDSVYASPAITKFINCLMLDGKKSTAERIFYGALDLAGSRLNIEPAEVFEKAMTNVRPLVEVRPRRVGGAYTAGDVAVFRQGIGENISRHGDVQLVAGLRRGEKLI